MSADKTGHGGALRLRVVGSKDEADALGVGGLTGFDGVFAMPALSPDAVRNARRLRRWEERSDGIGDERFPGPSDGRGDTER